MKLCYRGFFVKNVQVKRFKVWPKMLFCACFCANNAGRKSKTHQASRSLSDSAMHISYLSTLATAICNNCVTIVQRRRTAYTKSATNETDIIIAAGLRCGHNGLCILKIFYNLMSWNRSWLNILHITLRIFDLPHLHIIINSIAGCSTTKCKHLTPSLIQC